MEVKVANGEKYEMEIIRNYMDDEICEEIHGTVETDQEFYEEYCRRHEAKFEEIFEFEKDNPQI